MPPRRRRRDPLAGVTGQGRRFVQGVARQRATIAERTTLAVDPARRVRRSSGRTITARDRANIRNRASTIGVDSRNLGQVYQRARGASNDPNRSSRDRRIARGLVSSLSGSQ